MSKLKRSLSLKLTLSVVAVSLLGVLIAGAFAGVTAVRALIGLSQQQALEHFVEDVSLYYRDHQSWDGVRQMLQEKARAGRQPPPKQSQGSQNRPERPPPPSPPPRHVLVDQHGEILVGIRQEFPVGQILAADKIQGIPILYEEQVVGTVLTNTNMSILRPGELIYVRGIYTALGVGMAGAIIAALILGIILVRTLTRPLRELTQATRAVAEGDLQQQVPVRSEDELGELAASFNQMSTDLARSNQLRRQMTADIAHDLRTPLTVLAGYIESLRDGVLKPSATMMEVMYDEAQHLQRLVEDLRTLSLADANELPLNLQPTSPRELLEKLATAHAHQANQVNVSLKVEGQTTLSEIAMDPERMTQVVGNLVSNALRYTPTGGCIKLSAQQAANGMVLTVQDNGTGIAPEDLPRIFDRFYRADESRPHDTGESGLGLAIAKSIVEAHGGRISAESTIGQGTTFKIVLPIG